MEDIASPTRACVRELFEVGPGLSMDWDTCCKTIAEWREENGHAKMSKKGIERDLVAIDPAIRVRRSGPRGDQIWRVEGLATIEIAERKRKREGKKPENVVLLRDEAMA
jgi:hypothetical protein